MDSNKECAICLRSRSSVSQCLQCNSFLCSECFLIHRDKHEEEINQIRDQYNDLMNKISEKDKYINETSSDSIEIVVNWYQRLINDLIESQTQIIDNIQNERDRARDELAKFDLSIQMVHKDIQKLDENMNINSVRIKLNDLATKLSNYQITKNVYLPNSQTFQPRYKVSYEFKNSSSVEEDWDIDTNEGTIIPLPAPQTTASLFFSDTSQTFVPPNDDDHDEGNHFQWYEQLEEEENSKKNSEYLFDPSLYHLGSSRHFNSDIHLIASNGTDLLCYSRQTKQLIFTGDGSLNPLTLHWYHGHIIQLVWFDNLKSFVTITDNNRFEIYTIESTSNFRLKIRLRTCLPQPIDDIIKDQIFLRTDESHIFIYYERLDGRKRLRLLNSKFECVQSYAIEQCMQRDEHIRSNDNGLVIGLGVNQDYVVLFVQSMIPDDLSGQAASSLGDTRLLVFNKSKMCFIRRIILSSKQFQSPFIVHFLDLSSYFLIDQLHHILRFYNYEKQIGQIHLLPTNTSPKYNSTTISESNIDGQYSSIVLMNDGSVLLSNNTKNLIQLILNDQSNELDDW